AGRAGRTCCGWQRSFHARRRTNSFDHPQERAEEDEGEQRQEDGKADRTAETDAQDGGRRGGGGPRQRQSPFGERAEAAQRAAGDGERQEQTRQERARGREHPLRGREEGVAQALADSPALSQAEAVPPAAQEEVAGVVEDQEDDDRTPPPGARERDSEGDEQADRPESGPDQAVAETAERAADGGLEAFDDGGVRALRLEPGDGAERDGHEIRVAVEEAGVTIERFPQRDGIVAVADAEQGQQREGEARADQGSVIPRALDREGTQEHGGAHATRRR